VLWEALYASADKVKALAASHGLTIVAIQPLNQFDGWPAGHPRKEWSRRKAEKWLPMCSKFEIEMLQVSLAVCCRLAQGTDRCTDAP
jgi:sugar phosphate isomerase/epimerase